MKLEVTKSTNLSCVPLLGAVFRGASGLPNVTISCSGTDNFLPSFFSSFFCPLPAYSCLLISLLVLSFSLSAVCSYYSPFVVNFFFFLLIDINWSTGLLRQMKAAQIIPSILVSICSY